MEQETITKQKKYTFKSEGEREIGVCIAIQKTGLASIVEIIEKIETWGGKITEKQAVKSAENLRRRGLLSIDLSTKNEDGIALQRYVMKSIKLSIPEVAQIKDLVDDPSMNPLKEELDRSKKTMKKGLKTFDYYTIKVQFKTRGLVQGFVPDDKGVIRHYKEDGEIIFFPYHFKNWFRANLPLINRASSAIGDIYWDEGKVIDLPGDMVVKERWITNIESGFSSSRGTGGRGAVHIECLPKGSVIETTISFPRDLIKPERIKEALNILTMKGGAFGGGAKLSTGRLAIEDITIENDVVWTED